MNKHTCLVFFCLFSSLTVTISDERFPVNLKLFVFGDSYADTGNWPKSYGGSWQEPYGITFPGTPSGRFSDGRVLTDYIAGILGTKSPITYGGWKSGEKKSIRYGMNFAYGGTGVFNTLVNQPNMTTQINYFQQLIQQKQDLLHASSIAILSLAGNDYATYFTSNHTLKRIHELGVRKIGITTMEPLGCLPQFTVFKSYQKCSNTENSIAEFHNQVLVESVRKLNNESDGKSLFVILDLYKAFLIALNLRQNLSTGNSKLEMLLKPCCQGVSKEYSCGNVEKDTKILKYSVCGNPNDSFFWDMIHPSQRGWHAVSSSLRSSLLQLL
ncbi:GDSL esterase/lipase At5g03610-like isoform X2 [Cynara cardunculus var. scolymus]|uniref:GDSL esterase/lipase At5g03610-like isoform X2 n=1 Tax=Cynara cardunculus var. scolymus TaxID=59895 RepID=UPI000D62B133|nr:GDSL esterase/lipase At5g03610-like isoform X2 [Cynara cardunculus var. scolymus]